MTAVGADPLAGRYRRESRIAAGGMGEVWRAHDLLLDRPVAVKLLRPDHVGEQDRERFRAEARHAAGLSHPGIASVYDYGEQDGAAWLVMELVEGEPLSDVLRRGPLDVATALSVVGQAGLALEAAHAAGVVHRDVKPGNLLVTPDGTVKVTDFGIAHAGGSTPLADSGTVVGTVYYLSPEQVRGEVVTGASDVYALGVVAYECLTGRRPFDGGDPDAIADAHLHDPPPPLPTELPERVRDLVLAALAKDPADRPGGAGELGRTALALRESLRGSRGSRLLPVLMSGVAGDRLRHPIAGRHPHERHHRAARLAASLLVVVAVGAGARACLAPTLVAVPRVTAGADLATATRAVEDSGLHARQRTEPSGAVPVGVVLRTEPPAGTQLASGRLVTLVVSAGPGPGAAPTAGPPTPPAPPGGTGGDGTAP